MRRKSLNKKAVGHRIRELRNATGWGQNELQKIANIPGISVVSKYERGIVPPPLPHLIAIASSFQVSVDYILTGNDKEEPFQGIFNPQILAARLKEVRKSLGMTYKDFAAELECSNGTVNFYENGTIVPPTKSFFEITKIYDCTADFLLSDRKQIVSKKFLVNPTETENSATVYGKPESGQEQMEAILDMIEFRKDDLNQRIRYTSLLPETESALSLAKNQTAEKEDLQLLQLVANRLLIRYNE